MFIVIHRFLTVLRVQNIFRPHENAKLVFSNTSRRFKERFRKGLFSSRISVDDKPSRRNKAASSTSSDVETYLL